MVSWGPVAGALVASLLGQELDGRLAWVVVVRLTPTMGQFLGESGFQEKQTLENHSRSLGCHGEYLGGLALHWPHWQSGGLAEGLLAQGPQGPHHQGLHLMGRTSRS